MSPRVKHDWRSILAQADDQGLTGVELAAQLDVDPSQVSRARRTLGLPSASQKRGIDWDVELADAERNGETVAEVARRLGVHWTTVRDAEQTRGILLSRQRPGPPRDQRKLDWKTILAAAVRDGLTKADVRRQTGASSSQLARACRTWGVDLPNAKRGKGRRAAPPRPSSAGRDDFDQALPSQARTAKVLKRFLDALDETGAVTIRQIEATGVASRKTILKHIRAGELEADKATVDGRPTWLIKPEHAQLYLTRAVELIQDALKQKHLKGRENDSPEGLMTIKQTAEACGVSHWTVRQHLTRCGVTVHLGRNNAKLLAYADLPALKAYFDGMARSDYQPRPAAAPIRGRIKGGPYIADFETLWAVLRSQPETTAAELAAITGSQPRAAQRWMDDSRSPGPAYQPALTAHFRERFQCRLSPDLEVAAKAHRRAYMKRYMAARRTTA